MFNKIPRWADCSISFSHRYSFTKHAAVPKQILHFAYAHHEKLLAGNAQVEIRSKGGDGYPVSVDLQVMFDDFEVRDSV